jgi:hypothetical protein
LLDPSAAARRLEQEVGSQTLVALSAQGPATRAQRCALLNCLIVRTAGAQRAPFEAQAQELACNAQTVVPPHPVGPTPVVETTFLMSDIERRAYSFDTALQSRVQAAHALTVVGAAWRLSVAFRADLTASVRRYELAQGSASTTPHRSTLNWALHGAGAGVGVAGLVSFAVLGALCTASNQPMVRTNAGQALGVDRGSYADSVNFCRWANIALVVGGTATVVTATSFYLTRPRITVAPTHAGNPGFTFTASF